jgi:hypothetical protein
MRVPTSAVPVTFAVRRSVLLEVTMVGRVANMSVRALAATRSPANFASMASQAAVLVSNSVWRALVS